MQRWANMRGGLLMSLEARQAITSYIFLLPWLIGLALFVLYPLGYSLYMSFHRVRFTGEGMVMEPYAFSNFTYIFWGDNQFVPILMNVFKNSVVIIPVIIIFALFISILLNQRFPGRMFFRAIFFLPVIFGTGQVLSEIFFQNAGGMELAQQYDIATFIATRVPSFWATPILTVLNMFVLILWYSGVQILIFLSGLQTISKTVYEASRIDGATKWEMFWKITLPAMSPFIVLNIIYTVVDMFTLPLINPILQLIVANMQNPTLGYGYASAQGWVYFIVIFVFLAVVLGLSRRYVHYAGER